MVQGKAPLQPIPGSMASSSLLSYIAVSKFVDHLPLYRLEQKFKRISVDLPRETMARWMIKTTGLLTPLYNLMEEDLLGGGFLQMDETTVQVLKEPGRRAEAKSYMWVRARNEGGCGPPIVLYDYSSSRGVGVIRKLLGGYEGILQTDGYGAYDSYCVGAQKVLHAGCFAHARRKFWEAYKASKEERGSYADQGMMWFKKIYAVDNQAKGLSCTERRRYRQEHLAPLLSQFRLWLDNTINQVPSSLKTGMALKYCRISRN